MLNYAIRNNCNYAIPDPKHWSAMPQCVNDLSCNHFFRLRSHPGREEGYKEALSVDAVSIKQIGTNNQVSIDPQTFSFQNLFNEIATWHDATYVCFSRYLAGLKES